MHDGVIGYPPGQKSELVYHRQRCVAEIKIRAKRKAGELLKAMPKNEGGKPEQESYRSHDATTKTTPTLSAIGLTKSQSSRFQQVAEPVTLLRLDTLSYGFSGWTYWPGV